MTGTILEAVLADLAAEGERLEGMVADLAPIRWRTPTPASGWDVATQIAHLAWTDEVAIAAATDKESWHALVIAALGDPDGFVDAQAIAGARADPDDLLERWRSARTALGDVLRGYPAGQRMPWFGPAMSATSMATARFMETWAHALDVAEGLGMPAEPTDRIRHVAHIGVRTRDFAFALHGLEPPTDEFSITLVSPSEEVWSWGPVDAAQTVVGSAYDFCLLVTQRRHRTETDLEAVGVDADRWLDIAQAFAGPPGEGRPPRG